MALDFRAILASMPGDEAQVQALLKRFDEEGYSQELYADVNTLLQGRIDANLDAMGAPPVDENDPQLLQAAQEAVAQTQAALDKLDADVAGIQTKTADFSRNMAGKLDAEEVELIHQGISQNP